MTVVLQYSYCNIAKCETLKVIAKKSDCILVMRMLEEICLIIIKSILIVLKWFHYLHVILVHEGKIFREIHPRVHVHAVLFPWSCTAAFITTNHFLLHIFETDTMEAKIEG